MREVLIAIFWITTAVFLFEFVNDAYFLGNAGTAHNDIKFIKFSTWAILATLQTSEN